MHWVVCVATGPLGGMSPQAAMKLVSLATSCGSGPRIFTGSQRPLPGRWRRPPNDDFPSARGRARRLRCPQRLLQQRLLPLPSLPSVDAAVQAPVRSLKLATRTSGRPAPAPRDHRRPLARDDHNRRPAFPGQVGDRPWGRPGSSVGGTDGRYELLWSCPDEQEASRSKGHEAYVRRVLPRRHGLRRHQCPWRAERCAQRPNHHGYPCRRRGPWAVAVRTDCHHRNPGAVDSRSGRTEVQSSRWRDG